MDRDWMYGGRNTIEYLEGVKSFIKFAEQDMKTKGDDTIPCPCKDCLNLKRFHTIETVKNHLIRRGFKDRYTRWTRHGESYGETSTATNTQIDQEAEDGSVDSDQEMSVDNNVDLNDNLEEMFNDIEQDCTDKVNDNLQKLYTDSEKPLFPGCTKFTKLSTVLKLYNLKASNGWSDKSFTALLKLLGDMLPDENELPRSCYQAKKLMCPMGLEVERIHACPNDCILYRNEYENRDVCPKCGESRYKRKNQTDGNDDADRKGPPAKVIWYFPVIPRFKRLFANPKDAQLLRWHSDVRKTDGKLRHPADSPQWRNIDRKFREFGGELRNLRLGFSTDDNPHRLGSRGYDVKKRVWKKKFKENSEDLAPILDITDRRCQSYVLSRMITTPEGTLQAPQKTQDLIETIKENQRKVASGELNVSGSSDILTVSLGNPEHSGRTRGLGAYVTWKQGLNAPRASRKRGFNQANMMAFAEEIQRQCYATIREEMKEEMLEQVKDLRAEILAELRMERDVPDQNSPGVRHSSQHSNVVTSPLDSIQDISPCYLTCKVGEEHIKMANARVWPRKQDENIHCVPMLEDHMKVQVDSAVDEIYLKFPLPTKINVDFSTIEDTLGSFIQWPKDSIILDESTGQDASMPESTPNEEAESTHRAPLISKKLLTKVGPEFQAIHDRVMREPPNKNEFLLTIPEGVLLSQETLINLGFDDLTDLAKQDMLDVSIISIWVIYLKRLLTDLGREADVGILDPSRISHTLFETDKLAASSYLLESLTSMQEKKFILAPYYEFKHWVLLALVMRDNMVYVLDSLAPAKPNYDIMLPFKDIFKAYVDSGGVHKEGSTECEWEFIKCPRQVGSKVCGFYVMKHMQDLVTTQFDAFPNCDLPKDKYTPTQLHVITRQWCLFFLNNY